MRRALAGHTGLAVLLWFFAAPFFHLHAASSDGHHHDQEVGHDQDAIVHFHMADRHDAGEGAGLSATEEDEKPLGSFAIVQKHGFVSAPAFLPAAEAAAAQPPLDMTQPVVMAHEPKAHDPPEIGKTQPRAPPA